MARQKAAVNFRNSIVLLFKGQLKTTAKSQRIAWRQTLVSYFTFTLTNSDVHRLIPAERAQQSCFNALCVCIYMCYFQFPLKDTHIRLNSDYIRCQEERILWE